jgi:hypothetical protein
MPDILHRISIDAPGEAVHDLVATTDGIARWRTGRPLEGDSAVGSRFGIYFGDAGAAAAAVRQRRDDAAVRPRPLGGGERVHARLQHQVPALPPGRDKPLGLRTTTAGSRKDD